MNPARALPALLLLAGCAAPYQLVDTVHGEELSLSHLADRLQSADVVIVGENHGSDEGHEAQLDLVAALHRRRPDLVVSMEMFERDVQLVLWEYLFGDITEQDFLADSRPWPNYARHYRPIVQYAKTHRLPVIAANVPRPLAARVAREGLDSVRGEIHAARQVTAPRNEYWERFQKAMTFHPGARPDEQAMYRTYLAQCLKDDTMAESIVDYLKTARAELRRPLVVHINGSFHSDHGLGVAARVRNRAPDREIVVLSTVLHSNRREAFLLGSDPPAPFVILVPDLPPRPTVAVAAAEERPARRPEKAETPREPMPASRPATRPTAAPRAAPITPAASNARPALGFRPDHEYDGQGVRVAALQDGGPAARAKVHEGDILIGVASFHVADLREYTEVLSMLRVGEEIEVVVRRGGMIRRMQLTVGQRRDR